MNSNRLLFASSVCVWEKILRLGVEGCKLLEIADVEIRSVHHDLAAGFLDKNGQLQLADAASQQGVLDQQGDLVLRCTNRHVPTAAYCLREVPSGSTRVSGGRVSNHQ